MDIADDNSQHPLLSVPLEVLLSITRSLKTPEYTSFRLTCRGIEQALHNAFANEFFSKRQFMLTKFSLQALVDISKSRFGPNLKHIIFGLEQPYANPRPIIPNPNGAIDIAKQNNQAIEERVEHIRLLATDQDVEMMAEAFGNLRNLETVGMRDFNSRSRYRDYPNVEWRSYGFNTFSQGHLQIPAAPIQYQYWHVTLNTTPEFLSRLFLSVLRALGKSHSSPHTFEVLLRRTALQDHAFNLPPNIEPVVAPVLGNLKTLFLDINSDHPPLSVDLDGKLTSCASYQLRAFMSHVKNLEHLRLNFQHYRTQETNNILLWLSEPAPPTPPTIPTATGLPPSPPPIEFPALKQLDIGMISLSPDTLLALTKKFRRTLKTLSLHKVSLLHPDTASKNTKTNLWTRFFANLSKIDLKLSAINLSNLSQEHVGKKHFRQIKFEDSKKQPMVRKWGGSDVQSGLRDFIAFTKVLEQDHDTESEKDDDSDDSMDDVSDYGDGDGEDDEEGSGDDDDDE